MKATRSYRALHALQATEHRLSAVIEGVEYVASYALPHATYEHLDPAFATKMIESHLWTNLMRTIEHNLRKNLHHA
jgi:hypothetical protein